MSKSKRFVVKKIGDDFCIINSFDYNVVIYCDNERVIQECCDLLNELTTNYSQLQEENEYLKEKLQSVTMLKDDYQYKDILIEFCTYFNSNYHTCWNMDRCKEVIDDFIKFKEWERK